MATRNEVAAIFEGATDEQINAFLNLNSRDIGKAKGSYETIQQELTTAKETIKSLEANAGNVEELTAQIEKYRKAEADRAEAEKKAAAHAAMETRFNAASGDRTYIHEMVRKGVMNEFEAALADEANTGKSDKEIFEALVQDKGYFANQNPPAPMPEYGNVGVTNDHMAAMRAAMGLKPKD